MAVRIQMRRGTTSQWNDADPTLNEGEIGYNTTLGAFKIGDGSTIWSELDYYQTAASITPQEINAIDISEKGAANGVAELDASENVLSTNAIVFEGTTADTNEVTLQIAADPVSDITITLPSATGTLISTADSGSVTNTMLAGSIANEKLSNSSITINGSPVSLGGSISLPGDIEGVTAGTGLTGGGTSGTVTLNVDTTIVATTNNTITLSNKSLSLGSNTLSGTISDFNAALSDGDFSTIAGTETLSNKTISGTSNTITNVANTSLTNSSITVNGTSISLGGSQTITAANPNALTIGAGLSGTSYDGASAVTVAIDSTVATTSGSQTLTNKTLSSGTALSADLSAATYKITGLGTPSASTDAATKQYVDDIAQGLHIHASCVTATTNNIDLSSGLEAGDVIDGVTLVAGDRVLVKNQSTTSQNGIYLAVTSGAAVRASDFDSSSEIQGGDFVFVTGGTANDNTGWVQTEKVNTVGTDPIVFVQFSGAGTYQAGNGLTLTGNIFSINTGTTVDTSTAQTLTNKTLSSPSISGLYISDSSIVFEGSVDNEFETTFTITNPTADRTITFADATGTVALQGFIPASLTWGDLKNGKSA